ncbi:tRNA (cytosine-5-)-methyltransferase [Wickerhamomyces ciferrii]|uniref:tRNA (Cytosine-5-)-methyltransferase n=1 Tax=Wickerhamomyces ciferrii (strain ATCC 14091 / BCRC 22168 / CBS 111 / JCM 3599 / NBRC 0793 / NRRL Y-1031 F-60-10) TaxID=1206466 RepID=K0KIE8_WICCF|nr:tRNA (cytosine-5-)-methyltransferase [Wickerhamomyces ciferrii]CCH40933.1 tRNA (cytosine-5-)-methyltransferase [Wickerhamomyces ciferrii]
MGKRNFRGRNYKGKNQSRDPAEQKNGWDEIVRENEKWENYYKSQNLMNDEDFQIFKKFCQNQLPLTFRITGSKSHANEILKIFKERHLKYLSNLEFDGEPLKAPQSLSWYPNELAWQIDVPKQVIRKNENFAKTQRFLVIETEVGNISRQEAVSMIPPILLKVEPHHKVLDMCAAPGSKTAQLIESLHSVDDPTGFVVANDSDHKRAHMLIHQVKRLNSPNLLVVNHDAQFFPKTKLGDEFMKFDRILCDVPCSGDGTIRKNAQIWNKWSIGDGIGLNPLQYKILQRGLDLLAKGGRLVYSTCSLNPMENESVILQALRKNKDVRIVKTEIPGLVYSKGLKNWKVIGKDYEEKQKGQEDNYGDELFPPSEDEDYNLDDCIRVYPHQQNTGGFFITVLEKIQEDGEEEPLKKKAKIETKTTSTTTKKEKLSNSSNDAVEPFNFLSKDQEELIKCWKFYGINPENTVITENCFVRNATGEPSRIIYLSSPIAKEYLLLNEEKLKIIHSGVKIFVSQRTDLDCKWRIQSEALPIIKKHLSDVRMLSCSMELFEKLLKEAFPKYEELENLKIDLDFTSKITKLSQGCAFITIKRDVNDELEELIFPVWVGNKCVNLMLSKKETFEVLYRVFNVETSAQQEYKQGPTGPRKAIGEESKEETTETVEETPEVKETTEEPEVKEPETKETESTETETK